MRKTFLSSQYKMIYLIYDSKVEDYHIFISIGNPGDLVSYITIKYKFSLT